MIFWNTGPLINYARDGEGSYNVYVYDNVLDTAGAGEPRKGKAQPEWACQKPARRESRVASHEGLGWAAAYLSIKIRRRRSGWSKVKSRVPRVDTCVTRIRRVRSARDGRVEGTQTSEASHISRAWR